MTIKEKTLGPWATPPTTNNTPRRPLTGRVIFGMLTGDEGPEPTTNDDANATKRRA